jgi:hypothetical protein
MASNDWGVDLWGSALTDAWKAIKDPTGRTIKVYGFNQIPATITDIPCAFSVVSGLVEAPYSAGGDNVMHWKGKTEFHLTLDLSLKNLSILWPYFKKIIDAAAASISLGGKVRGFFLNDITLDAVQFGAETEHYALIATWELYESVVGKITVGG